MGETDDRGSAERPALGRTLDGYRLDRLLGHGSFSWVASGVRDDGQRRAFKVAGPLPEGTPPELTGDLPTHRYRTLSLEWRSEGFGPRPIDPLEALALQWRRLNDVDAPGLVAVEGEPPSPDRPWYRMEHLGGPTLREAISSGAPLPLQHFIDLTRTLGQICRLPRFQYHGDLKPENVLLTPDGPRLIDPGYFGPIGDDGHVIVATPAYNPHLVGDDRDAIGIILWEAACREHPYSSIMPELLKGTRVERAGIGPISSFLWRLPERITPPLHTRDCEEPELRSLLYRALMIPGRHRVEDERLTELVGRAFGSLDEIAEGLERLQRRGLEYLRICANPRCANPGQRECTRCHTLSCRLHYRLAESGDPFVCASCRSESPA